MYFIIFRLLLKLTKRDQQELEKKTQAVTLEMLQPSRYKPNDLEQMAEETKFSKSIFIETLESEHKKVNLIFRQASVLPMLTDE